MQFFKPGDAAPFTVTVVSMDQSAYTAQQQQQQHPQAWSTGLCDCMDDAGNCCMTCWCPCVTFGRVAEIVDRGSTSCGMSGVIYAAIMLVTCCQGLYSCSYRSKLRSQYNLPQAPCHDCCVHCSCGCCALCQEYRELKSHGFDMTQGWDLNMEKQRGATGFIQPPLVPGGMMR